MISARLVAALSFTTGPRRHGLVMLVGLLVAAFVVASPAAARPTLDRSTVDRPDDITGPQIHAVYVVPADGTDRALDTNGTIAASVSNWENWLRGQTGGHGLRLDTYGGAADVTYFRMSETDAQVSAMGAFVRDAIERELKSAGITKPGKLYAAYYDGNSTYACGGGAWPPTLPGIVAAVYLPPTFWNTVGDPCYAPERSLGGLQLMDLAILHELMHTMGFVATCAPHFTRAGHVSDSPTDLMYAGNEDWHPSVLDIGRDDYFDAHIPGCLDLSASSYLEGNDSFRLTVTLAGDGAGTVASSPAGINCGTTCAFDFDQGTSVTLTASAQAGSIFVGWRGDCSGAARCLLRMDASHSATASFASNRRCIVPNVKGKTLAAARRAITTANCGLGKTRTAFSARVKKGRVIAESPRPGTRLAKGSKVTLVVSKGASPSSLQ